MPASDPLNVFAEMEILQWRDVILPCSDWSHRFAHDTIQHHIIYRAGVAIDMLGAQARTFSYLLPLKQGILRAPHRNAFTSTYYRLYEAYRDKSPDTLIDPVHGPIMAVPGEWDASTTATDGMDGVVVRVTFTEDVPVDGAKADKPPTFGGLAQSAKSLDDETAVVNWKRPTPIPKLSDPLSIASGVLQQGNRLIEKTRAYPKAIANRANEIEEACEDLDRQGVPGTNGIRLAARKLRVDSTRLSEAAPGDVPGLVMQITVDTPKTAAEIARENGMDLADLIKMNAGIAKGPFVTPGSSIFVTRKRRRRR
jgi:hypothetical protein